MTLESKFKDEIGIEAYDKTLGTYSIRYVDWLENKLREQLTIHSVVKSLPLKNEPPQVVIDNGLDAKDYDEFIIDEGWQIDNSRIYKPIKLTEEWLLKMGFVKIDVNHSDGSVSKGVYKKYPIMIEVNKLDEGETPFRFCRIVPSRVNKWNFFCFVKYVHTLQNAFALTGEELVIKK